MSEESEVSWRDALSDEYKGNTSLENFKDVNDLAKSFLETKQHMSGMLRIPGEDAGDEDRAAFRQRLIEKNIGLMPTPDTTDEAAMLDIYRALGMPEDATGYEKIDGLSDDRFGQIAALALKAGVNKSQFKQVIGQLMEADKGIADQRISDNAAAIDQLKGEWGQAYGEKTSRVLRVAEATKAPESLISALKDGKIDAGTLRWMDSLASSLGQEGSPMATQVGAVTEDTKSELEAKRDELTRNIMNGAHSQKERERLIAKLVGMNEKLVA